MNVVTTITTRPRGFLVAVLIAAILLGSMTIARVEAQDPSPLARAKAALWASGRPEGLPVALDASNHQASSEALAQGGEAALQVAAPSARPDDAPVANWSELAFHSFRDGNYEIYTGKPDGTGLARVTADPSLDVTPRTSPDLSSIAFATRRDGNYEIYTVGRDGTGLRRLTQNPATDRDPAWSPDGKQLVFRSDRDGEMDLYVMSATGSDVRRLTQGGKAGVPAWSPDGSEVAYVKYDEVGVGALVRVNATTGVSFVVSTGLRFAGRPAWSHDGQWIALDCDADSDMWTELTLISRAGGLPNEMYDAGQEGYELWVGDYGPDGSSLAYTLVKYALTDQGLALAGGWVGILGGSYTVPWSTGLDFDPDWVSTDIQAPQTSLVPLPAYSPYSPYGVLTVDWHTTDAGGSGVRSWDIDISVNNGAWEELEYNWAHSLITFRPPATRDTVAVRVRGKDRAGNIEAWPADPQGRVSTRMYGATMGGRVHDVRGLGVPGATVTVQPESYNAGITVPDGRYLQYMPVNEPTTLRAEATGYAASDAVTQDVQPDPWSGKAPHGEADFVLGDPTSYLTGGRFESGALDPAWHGTGVTMTSGLTNPVHTGAGAAVIGETPELTSPVRVGPGMGDQKVVEAGGYVHVVNMRFVNSYNPYGIGYNRKNPSGEWLAQPALLVLSRLEFHDVVAAADPTGGLYLYWSTEGDARHLCYVAPETQTCVEQPLPEGLSGQPVLKVDDSGTLHALWRTRDGAPATEGLRYARRFAGSAWGATETVADETRVDDSFDLAVDGDGNAHALWSAIEGDLQVAVDTRYAMRERGGTWSTPEVVRQDAINYLDLRLTVDAAGTVHALVGDRTSSWEPYYYAAKAAGGDWTLTQAPGLFNGSLDMRMVGDAPEIAYMFSGTIYHFRLGQAGWQQLESWNLYVEVARLALDPAGIVHITWVDGYSDSVLYQSSRPPSAPYGSRLAQTVTLPPNVHAPTLSFYFAPDWGVVENRAFEVTVDDGSGASRIDLTGADVPAQYQPSWRHAWADMARWAGKTVTVTFAVGLVGGRPAGEVRLDDVSLGPWLTPAIRSASIDLDGNVMVQGDNFIGSPTVRVGDQTLATRRVGEDTLTAQLPGAIKPGLHIVFVTNEGGQATARGAWAGKSLWLPAINRTP